MICVCVCSESVRSVKSDGVMVWAIEELLGRYTVKASPIVKQAACVWLLSLVKYASKHPDFQVSPTIAPVIISHSPLAVSSEH